MKSTVFVLFEMHFYLVSREGKIVCWWFVQCENIQKQLVSHIQRFHETNVAEVFCSIQKFKVANSLVQLHLKNYTFHNFSQTFFCFPQRGLDMS